MITVLLADDHVMVREGLKYILSQAPELQVTAEASSVPEALELFRIQHFDVILLDLSLPGQSGMELAACGLIRLRQAQAVSGIVEDALRWPG